MRWILVSMAFALGLLPRPAAACEPEARLLCGRTLWVAPTHTASITYPGSAQAWDLPVDLVGVLQWNASPSGQAECAQPTEVSLSATLSCATVDGGAPVLEEAIDEALPLPTGPGLMDLGALDALLSVPAGIASEPLLCALEGSVEVHFEADEVGGGTVLRSFDLFVPVLPRSSIDPALPRLGLRQLAPAEGMLTARANDELLLWYAVENNDGEVDVTVELSVASQQIAVRPEGDDPDGAGFGLGGTAVHGLDVLFADDATAALIGGGDPATPSLPADRWITLLPGEATIVPILVRSGALCPDDAAADLRINADATWGSDSLHASVLSVLRVGVATPQSPLCDVTDSISSAPTVDGHWGPAVFDDVSWRATHPAGNLEPNAAGPATRVPGFSFASPYPEPAVDSLRSPQHPASVTWSVDLFPTQTAAPFETQHVEVAVTNLNDADVLNLPAIYDTQIAANTSVALDATTGQLTVIDLDSAALRFQGSLGDFFTAGPADMTVDLDTIREFVFNCDGLTDALALPRSSGFVSTLSEEADSVTIDLPDRRSGTSLAWTASVVDGPAEVLGGSGLPGDPLVVTGDLDALPHWPERALVRVSVVTDAANSPLELPLLLSRLPLQGDDDDSSDDDDDSADDDDAADDDDLMLGPDVDEGCACSVGSGPAWPGFFLGLLFVRRRSRCS